MQPVPGQVRVAAGPHRGQQRAQFLLRDPRGQDLRGRVLGEIAFHIFAKLLSDRRSRARSSRRRLAHSGSILRPRRSRRSQVTRRRTLVSASLASLTRWKWSTTSVAFGSSPGVRIAAA